MTPAHSSYTHTTAMRPSVRGLATIATIRNVSTSCEPRFATQRTRRRTLGPQVASVAKRIGLDLLPWQRLVLSVALEQARGRMAYRDCLISVPRQSGKSTLTLARIVWQLAERPGSRILYGAQTRVAARQKMLSGWWPRLAASPLGGDLKLFRGFGNETIEHANGSMLQLLSAAESAGHGETCDLVVVDEAWIHPDSRVEQSVRPTMATRKDAQLWAVSTAGTARSLWWKAKLDAGIAAAQMGVTDGLACFDWSAAPGSNPAEPQTWRGCMPALGRLVDEQTVAADLANMGVAEFARAFCNLWADPAGEGWQVFAQEAWVRARGIDD
jgi:phage terminase large subunit-like protein